MPDLHYFSKLRAFLCGRSRSRSSRRRPPKRDAVAGHRSTMFALEPLESRLLLAADLAGAAAQVIEPVATDPQPAAVLLLDEQSGTNNSVIQQNAYGNLPLSFEANLGQTENQVHYSARGDGYSLFLTEDGAVLSLRQDDGSAPTVLTMEMVGANPDAIITGEQLLPGVANYFIGNDPGQWRTDIPTYEQVQYDEIYTGIDLLYYGNQGQLEYDFVVAPGADPGAIQLRFTGADQVSLNEQGDLLLHVGEGGEQVTVQKPVLYQNINGNRQEVSGSFVLDESGTVSFQVGAYDPSQSLIIDPVLVYSTYVGGSQGDRSNSVKVDEAGQAYITGQTASLTFPLVNPIQNRDHWDSEGNAFVTKLNATGTAVDYSTYLGGTGPDEGFEIALDAAGNMYVGGLTSATNFPTTSGAFQRNFGGQIDGFITKLNPTGAALLYSTYLGGSNLDQVNGIAVDDASRLYAVGQTASGNYPTTPGAFQTANGGNPGGYDVFVTSLNASGSALLYSTYLGGTQNDLGNAIALDATGQAYVTGVTSSTPVGGGRTGAFPTTPGAFDEIGPQFGIWQPENAFITKLNPAGTSLVYSTILGGTSLDVGNGIAIDSSGHAYVAGATDSFNLPITSGAFQTSGSSDPTTSATARKGFVTKLNTAGSGLVYSTYLGGSGSNELHDIKLDTEGNTYLTGFTRSTDYPITSDALQAGHGSGGQGGTGPSQRDAIITVLNPTGSALVYSSYLGGNDRDDGNAIARDSSGNVYVTGFTGSSNFPTTNPSFQASPQGNGDAFVTKIGFVQPNQAPVANPDAYSVNEDTILTVAARGVLANDTDADNNPLTAAVVTGPANGTLTLNADGSFSYTPNSNFNGSDSFTYKANDGNADSNVATVNITVTPVNDAPAVDDQTFSVAENSSNGTVIGTIAATDPDAGDTLTFGVTGGTGQTAFAVNGTTGQITVADSAQLNFESTPGFTLNVEVTDGGSLTDTAVITINVTNVNEAPVLAPIGNKTVDEGSPLTFTATATDSDVPAQTLTFSLANGTSGQVPAGATINPSSGAFSWTPTEAQGPGTFTFDVVVTDNGTPALSDSETIQVIVNEVVNASFQGLGDLPGGLVFSQARDVSANGSVIVGLSNSASGIEAFRWTTTGGMAGLGDLPGGRFGSTAFGASADGSIVVGGGISGSGAEAFRWTTSGMVGLGDLPGGGFTSAAAGVSADGSVVVGGGNSGAGPQAFRWTTTGGMVGLGDLPGGSFSSAATDVSAAGDVVVGIGRSASGIEAFRWTASGMVGLGDLPGGSFFSEAVGVSADGTTVVGGSRSTSGLEAFRWTANGGMVGLGDLPGGSFFSQAWDASASGTVIVGSGNSAAGQEAFIWDSVNGMRNLKTVLTTEAGLGTSLTGWTLREATGISDDGRTIVGWGINPSGRTEGWRAVLA